jgi:gamma-glutamyltranspeptidase/glutathione hydrolase
MRRGGGILTHADLERYRPVWRSPIEFMYRGHKVISMPPPSSGGVTLAIICNILEGYDLTALGWHSTSEIHLVAEAMRRAFADRNTYLADPDVVSIPLDTLLSRNHAARWRSTINPAAATPSTAIHAGQGGSPNPGMHTTHLSVVDGRGNAVALTTTLNSLYGSAVTVTGAGFLMNNEMDDFAVKPGTPNMFGLVQGEANAIAPGKRILSSMTPTIVLDAGGKALLVTGARGGPYIISSVFNILSNVVDFSMDLPAAVVAPRVHHQHLPDQLLYEEGVAPGVVEGLKELGHSVKAGGNLGAAPSIMRRNAVWLGVPDGRSGGFAEGY